MAESSQYKMEARSLGPGNLQASPGDHTHDGITSKGGWASYTPTWASTGTQPVIGNGTLTGSYFILSNTVFFQVLYLRGSTTTIGTGNYRFGLPVAPASWYPAGSQLGTASVIFSTGSTTYTYFAKLYTVSGMEFQLANQTYGLVTNASPTTLSTAGGGIQVFGMYEKA